MLYILETYDREIGKEPVAYIKDEQEAIRGWAEKYEGEPYQVVRQNGKEHARMNYDEGEIIDLALIDEFEVWDTFMYEQHGVLIRFYESLEEIKKELDCPNAWINQSENLRSRIAIEKLYKDNTQEVTT